MADKKKMSVAEILAAARKADGGGGSSPSPPPTEAEEPAAASPPAEQAAAEAAPAAEAPKPGSVAEKLAAARAQKPSAAAASKPGSVAEKLAAARGQKPAGGDGAQPAAAAAKKEPAAAKAKPAAAKAKAGKGKAAAPAVPKDTSSILAAARTGAKPGPMTKAEAAARAPAAKAPAKPGKQRIPVPPMPAKPDYAKPKKPAAEPESRRSFLTGVLLGSFLGVGFTSLTTTFTLWTLGVLRFMFPNVLIEPPSTFKVGFPASFASGQVETKFKQQYGVWIVNDEYNGQPQIFALSTVCTHLGCTPNWLEGEQKFKCPCHGSGFYKDGINFEGPAPRPLERYGIRLADDGQLEVDKSKLFQEEIGQWSDPASFVAV